MINVMAFVRRPVRKEEVPAHGQTCISSTTVPDEVSRIVSMSFQPPLNPSAVSAAVVENDRARLREGKDTTYSANAIHCQGHKALLAQTRFGS